MEVLIDTVAGVPRLTRFGRVARMEGLLVEVTGAIGLGGRLPIAGVEGSETPCEVVGFRDGRALAMPFGQLEGVSLGARATIEERINATHPRYATLNKILEGVAVKGKTR